MSPKICSSHLGLLYEYLKTNNLAGVEAVEHELTGPEECVACAYVITADGGAEKEELINYLIAKGVLPKNAKVGRGKAMPLWLGGFIISLPSASFGFFLLKGHISLPISIFSALALFIVIFFLFKPFGGRRFFR